MNEDRYSMYVKGLSKIPTLGGIYKILVPIPENEIQGYIPISKLEENK